MNHDHRNVGQLGTGKVHQLCVQVWRQVLQLMDDHGPATGEQRRTSELDELAVIEPGCLDLGDLDVRRL